MLKQFPFLFLFKPHLSSSSQEYHTSVKKKLAKISKSPAVQQTSASNNLFLHQNSSVEVFILWKYSSRVTFNASRSRKKQEWNYIKLFNIIHAAVTKHTLHRSDPVSNKCFKYCKDSLTLSGTLIKVTLSWTFQQINQNKATQYRAFAHMLKRKQSATWNSKQMNWRQRNKKERRREGPFSSFSWVLRVHISSNEGDFGLAVHLGLDFNHLTVL